MTDRYRVSLAVVLGLVSFCVLSVVVFAVRNWSNPPFAFETESTDGAEGMPFTIVVPDGWKATPSEDETRDEKGARTYEWISNQGKTGISIAVKDVMKDGKTFDGVATPFVWTSDDVANIVAFMRNETGDLYKDFSEEDVVISAAPDMIGGAKAVRALQQCQKPCYVEGGAATTVRYLIDAPDRLFILEVTAGTGTSTADLLNEADAVVRTFKGE